VKIQVPRVVHFEIPADNPERAVKFYTKVFDWKIEKWPGPFNYWLATTGEDKEPGINGAIMEKTNFKATVNTVGVSSVDEFLKKIKVITISTDKAVNPINVMGATKLLAERLTIAANNYKGTRRTVFSCVRFGNVLGSRGSVIPLFKKQIQKGGPITITDPNMLRFVMSIEKAIDLVLKCAKLAKGGEIFIFKMPTLRIGDLAEVMIAKLAPKYGHNPGDIKIEIVGKRNGEKSYEDLMTEDEALHSYETEDMFVILPQITWNSLSNHNKTSIKHYTSKVACKLTKKQLRALLEPYLS
jgi:FlaA1/EpsC-like NDP-sugar epimerase